MNLNDACLIKPCKKNSEALFDNDWEQNFFLELGEDLKQRRLEKNETIEDISKKIKIKAEYLCAIEAGNITVLPGAFYTKGFIKSYCEYCDLKIEGQYLFINEMLKKIDKAQDIKLVKPKQTQCQPTGLNLIFALLLIVLGYGLSMYFSEDSDYTQFIQETHIQQNTSYTQ